MQFELINGTFDSKDALDILTQMVHIKIRHHENKITSDSSAEDIKFRDSKISKLQNELDRVRKEINASGGKISLQATVNIAD